jgi:predicted CXXCH cytochrome family protein
MLPTRVPGEDVRSRFALVAALVVLFGAGTARAATNPHIDTADNSSCLFCHREGFEAADDGEPTLLKDSIDELCLTCHVKTECCAAGQKHMDDLFIGYSHPSDLGGGDISERSVPKTLPLQDGRMTCNTCHYHRRPAGRDYKLVRLVDFSGDSVSWSRLCQDCHPQM